MTDELRAADAVIDVLKAALAAQGVETVPWPDARLLVLTGQERALVGALFGVFPKGLSDWAVLDLLPSMDRVKERDVRQVQVVVANVRRKLGRTAIERCRSLGIRLGPDLYAELGRVE